MEMTPPQKLNTHGATGMGGGISDLKTGLAGINTSEKQAIKPLKALGKTTRTQLLV